jgi:heat shock protein HslJ
MTRIPLVSAAVVATLGLAACEPVPPATPGASVPTGPYVLVGIGSDTVPQRNVGMTIEADGSISGQAPCNHYSAPQTGQPPGFALGALTTTDAACTGKAGQLETRYFEALSSANGIAYEGGVLTITGSTYLTYEPGYRKEK